MPRIDAFLQIGKEQGGSDIHFTVGQPPLVRLDGELLPIKYRPLSQVEVTELVAETLTPEQSQQLETRGSIDFSYEAEGLGRFGAHRVGHQRS